MDVYKYPEKRIKAHSKGQLIRTNKRKHRQVLIDNTAEKINHLLITPQNE